MYNLIKTLDGTWLNLWVLTLKQELSTHQVLSGQVLVPFSISVLQLLVVIYRLKKQITVLSILLSTIGNCSTSVTNYFKGNMFHFENAEKDILPYFISFYTQNSAHYFSLFSQ